MRSGRLGVPTGASAMSYLSPGDHAQRPHSHQSAQFQLIPSGGLGVHKSRTYKQINKRTNKHKKKHETAEDGKAGLQSTDTNIIYGYYW